MKLLSEVHGCSKQGGIALYWLFYEYECPFGISLRLEIETLSKSISTSGVDGTNVFTYLNSFPMRAKVNITLFQGLITQGLVYSGCHALFAFVENSKIPTPQKRSLFGMTKSVRFLWSQWLSKLLKIFLLHYVWTLVYIICFMVACITGDTLIVPQTKSPGYKCF